MKRRLAKLLMLVPVILLALLIVGILSRKARAEAAIDRIRMLPDLVMTDINGVTINTANITSGPLLITFFHPECDHCRYELTSLLAGDSFDHIFNILLISYAGTTEIRSFIQGERILDTSHIYIISDPDFNLTDLFGAKIFPANYIYNDSLQLVKIFKGSVKPETIMKYLHGSN